MAELAEMVPTMLSQLTLLPSADSVPLIVPRGSGYLHRRCA
jgi:hypothetical protein